MTTAYSRASLPIPSHSWLDDSKLDVQHIKQRSKDAIRILLILAAFGAVTAAVVATKVVLVMSRFNYFHS